MGVPRGSMTGPVVISRKARRAASSLFVIRAGTHGKF